MKHGFPWDKKYVDKTDRICFSKSFDLAGQNKILKGPEQVYIAKAINIGRCFDRLFDFCQIFGRFWDTLGIIWG